MNNSQLITKIRKSLNFANKKFYREIKKNKNISDNFKITGSFYRTIIKNLVTLSPLPAELQFYKLAAELGCLQCKVNSFGLSPMNDRSMQKNENQLKNFARRIQDFLNLCFQLEPKLNFYGNPKLFTQFYQFKRQLNKYAKNWEKNENDIVAAYTYNYADFLLQTYPFSLEKTEKAIIYLQQSSICYANNLRHKEKKQTQHKLSEAKALLTQLQPNRTALKVSIPLFLISRIKNETIQSVSIHTTLPHLSSKIKSAQPNPLPSSIQNKFLQPRHTKQVKTAHFRTKKINAMLCQNCLFSQKNPLAAEYQSEEVEIQSSHTLNNH